MSVVRQMVFAAATLAVCVVPATAQVGVIGTVAGTGVSGYNGEGILASSAQLAVPFDVEPTPDGGYLVAEQGNQRVRKVGPGGIITTVAGNGTTGFSGDGGPATAAQLNAPNAVAVLPDGSILIADSNNNRIRMVTPAGIISTVAGTGAGPFNGDGIAATSANIAFPAGVAVLPDGSFLVADNDNHRIRRVAGGVITTVAGTGVGGGAGDGGPATAAQILGPAGIATMPDGGYSFTEVDGHRVRRVGPDGVITRVAGTGAAGGGGDGGPAALAQLSSPVGIGALPDGSILIADTGTHRIRHVSSAATISTIAGTGVAGFAGDGGTSTSAQLASPFGVTARPSGEVLIADTSNQRVRRVAPPPPEVTGLTTVGAVSAGRPIVMSASVVGNATAIEWNLDSDPAPEVVGAAGQTALMFRPPPGLSTVQVRVTGPGGVSPIISQQISIPAFTGGSAVVNRLKTQADALGPVYATGAEAPLLSVTQDALKAACLLTAPTTVHYNGLEITGCIRPIRVLGDIPTAERGILQAIANSRLFTTTLTPIGLLVQLRGPAFNILDGYVANGPVRINGVTMQPNGSAVVALYPAAKVIASSNASMSVGGINLQTRPNFVLDTSLTGGQIPLGTYARGPGGLRRLAGFALGGDVRVSLIPGTAASPAGAQITTNLSLPSWLTIGGVRAEGQVVVRVSTSGQLVLDQLRIGPIDASIADALDVEGLQLDYAAAGAGQWRGQGKACVISGACLDMIPPNGGVTVTGDALSFAGASLTFPPPGIALFPGINLDRIGFGVGLDPTLVTGNARVNAAKIYDIEGRVLFAFPSVRVPYVFDAATAGPGFPAGFYGRVHTRPTVAMAANATVRAPVVGNIPLGNGYLLYEFPGYVAFGGGVGQNFFDILRLTGRIDGEVNARNGRFNLSGQVETCVVGLCRGAVGIVSSTGVGGCINLAIVSIGGGVIYSPFEVVLWPLDGCKWSRFRAPNVRDAQLHGADGTQAITIRAGDPSRAIRLTGTLEAPRVRVTGPNGVSVESSADTGLATGGPVRILRSVEQKLTVVGLQDARPGQYVIAPLDGAVPASAIAVADDLPDARVTARVGGSGTDRTLTYDILRRPNQKVSFVEIAPGAGAREIGVVAGGGRGTLRFTSAPGRGARQIEARFELNGLPAERRVVARFAAPAPQLARPTGLRVVRNSTRLRVTWRPVAGASAYEVVLTTAAGKQRVRRTTGRALALVVARTDAGRVTVRAVSRLRDGRPTTATFARLAPRVNRVKVLPRGR